MPWPRIFFPARKPRPEVGLPPPFKPSAESEKSAPSNPQPPAIQPVPDTAGPKIATSPVSLKPVTGGSSGPTLPAIHGVVLRPPAKLASLSDPTQNPPPPRSQAPLKNIEQLMAEADPVHTLRQTGNLRILKPLTQDPTPVKLPAKIAPETTPLPPGATPSGAAATSANPAASVTPSVPVPLEPTATSLPVEEKKPDPELKSEPSPLPAAKEIPRPPVSASVLETADDSPFILKPAAPPEPALKVLPPTAPSLMPFGSIFRRKAKMTEVARIVLPPKRDESQPLPVPSEPSPTVVPPAFPVVAMTARVNQPAVQEKIHASPAAPVEKAAPEKSVAEEKILGAVRGDNAPGEVALPGKPEAPSPGKTPGAESQPEKPDGSKTEPASIPTPLAETKPAASPGDLSDAPKVDPEAHKPEPSAAPVPKADPEAPKVASKPAAELSVPPATPEKREFHLANGERVAGVVLSETPEAVYIEHGTLGVLTIPRANIAKRLVEIILINGDRIVGDIMAETADTLYVRHASLGMLTVPRAQRSTRVVEAILKDGDRILGEVLTETDTFTVIRSATLGTITVPHGKMAMLNRKIEQIEMKALPPPAAEIKESRPSA